MAASLDWLDAMHYVNQTDRCRNGCGVAVSKGVLDYEHSAYGSPSYTFDQVRQSLDLTCCSEPGSNCPGVCLGYYNPSIEHTLESLGTTFFWVTVEPGSQSTWFNRVVTSVSARRYPQVLLVSPNWDGPGGVYLDGWADERADAQHYIAVSGYNSTDNNVRYQESAWWTAGDKWWYASMVWSVNYNTDANGGCVAPHKLIY